MIDNLISVVIVTWNSMATLKECLDSVYLQKHVNFEVIVIDNGSTDGSREFITKNYPEIKTMFLDENIGYSKANNKAIDQSSGEYILLLNSDAILAENCVFHFISAIKTEPATGSVSGKVLKMDPAKKIIDSTGIILNRKTFSPSDRGEGELDLGQHDKQEYIFGVSGAAAFFSRKMLEDLRVNGEIFDEDFFAYYEDLDLSWRAQLYGWKCLYVPEALIYHIRKGPKSQNSKVYAHSFKNRYLCYIKNDSARNFLEYFPFNIGYELLRCVKRFILEPSLIKSVYLTLVILPKMLRKRRIIQQNRRVSLDYLRKFT